MIDCLTHQEAHRATVLVARPSGTGRPIRRFYFATENDATGKPFEKDRKRLGSSRSREQLLEVRRTSKSGRPKRTATLVSENCL